MFRFIQAATCAVALMLAVPVEAQESKPPYPKISAKVEIEIEFDRKYDSDDTTKEVNDLFTETELELELELTPELKITLGGQLKPIRKADPDEDRVFDDHGLFAEELYLTYEDAPLGAFIGKFTPNFGRAWDGEEAPGSGIFGTEFAEEGYELAERIGFGGSFTLDAGEAGSHKFTASTFFLDTSALSNSAFNKRGQTRRTSGGVSNTGDFASYGLALDGEDMEFLPGFTYHAAFVRQKEGVDGTTDETGYALSATYQGKWGEVEITPFVEYVKFDDLGGTDGKDRDFLTTSLLLEWNSWNLAISRTGRDTEEADGSDFDDHLIQVSFGYQFDSGLVAELGWHTEKEDEENVTTNVVGVRLSYSLKF